MQRSLHAEDDGRMFGRTDGGDAVCDEETQRDRKYVVARLLQQLARARA